MKFLYLGISNSYHLKIREISQSNLKTIKHQILRFCTKRNFNLLSKFIQIQIWEFDLSKIF